MIILQSCYNDNDESEIRIPFSIENNRIILDAVVNGQGGRFVFDSGVMHSYLDINALNPLPVAHTKRIYNGKLKTVFIYALNKIIFGKTVLKTHSWLINRADSIKYLKEYEGYDGILGIRTFEGFWCELSFSRKEIVLYKEKPKHYTMYSPAEMLSKYDVLYLPITIDDMEYYFNIDTGLRKSLLFPNGIIEQKGSDKMREIVSNEEVKRYYLVKTNEICILDEIYNNMSIMTNSYIAQRRNNDPLFNDIGLIGVHFLKNYDLLFDYRNIRKGKTTGMYYNPVIPLPERDYGFFSFLEEAPELGILNFSISDIGLEIVSILKDSAAYTIYGLRPGIIITKIMDKSIADYKKEELIDPSFFHTITNFSILENGNERTIYLHE